MNIITWLTANIELLYAGVAIIAALAYTVYTHGQAAVWDLISSILLAIADTLREGVLCDVSEATVRLWAGAAYMLLPGWVRRFVTVERFQDLTWDAWRRAILRSEALKARAMAAVRRFSDLDDNSS
jgi:hypothetical protein